MKVLLNHAKYIISTQPKSFAKSSSNIHCALQSHVTRKKRSTDHPNHIYNAVFSVPTKPTTLLPLSADTNNVFYQFPLCYFHYVFPIRFAMFHNVRIPRENLLNRTGDVTPDGHYVTPFKVSLERHGQKAHYKGITNGE